MSVGNVLCLVAQSCPTLCDPIPGILQARTLEWVAISFSNASKWEVKVKSLSRVWLFTTPWTAAYQAPPSMRFSWQEYCSGVPLKRPNYKQSFYSSLELANGKTKKVSAIQWPSIKSWWMVKLNNFNIQQNRQWICSESIYWAVTHTTYCCTDRA